MKKLRKVLAVVTALVLAVSMLGTVSFASTSVTTVNVKDSVVSEGYTLTNAKTGVSEKFSYDTPEDGATILIFFKGDGVCNNSNYVFSYLSNEDWVGNDKINIIAIEGNNNSLDTVQSYISDQIGNIADDITVYAGGYYLLNAYENLLGYNISQYAFAICIDSTGYVTSYANPISSTAEIDVMVADYLSDGETDTDTSTNDTSDTDSVHAALAALEEAQAAYDEGSYGFFEWLAETDGNNAVYYLENAKYASYTVKGDSDDATSLANMLATIDFIKECNELRTAVGLNELTITSELMAMAQSNANYSDVMVQHSHQFSCGENLAYRSGSSYGPFEGWYDREIAIMYSAIANGSYDGEEINEEIMEILTNVQKNGYVTYSEWMQVIDEYSELSSAIGHYFNIVLNNYEATGFAICTRGSAYNIVYSQTFSGSRYSGWLNTTTYTVDEYETLLNEYVGILEANIATAEENYEIALQEYAIAQVLEDITSNDWTASQEVLDTTYASSGTTADKLADWIEDELATLGLDSSVTVTFTVDSVTEPENGSSSADGSYTVSFTGTTEKATASDSVTSSITPHSASEPTVENNVNPTCEETGSYDSVVYCSVCGIELSRETVTVDATGHDYKFTEWVWATDYSSATAVFTCANDSTHTIEVDADVTATGEEAKCEEDGYMDYVASVTFEGETYTSEAQRVVLEMTGHTAGEPTEIVLVERTCTVDGVSNFVTYCVDCGTELSREENVTVAAGHTWNDGEVTTEPTCTEEGVKTYTCTVCGETKTVAISALGHDYTSEVTTEPTCTEPGVRTYTCSRCADAYTEEIAALGHEYTSEVTTEPTCTETGVRTYTCSRCADAYTEEIAALGHEYTSEVTTEPTCTETGVRTYTCSRCGDTYTEEIDALGHEYTSEVTTEPTCTETGVRTYTCSRCGDTYAEEIAATGHTYGAPTFNWSTDHSVCTATFTCTSGDDEQTVTAIVTSTSRLGQTIYTASVEFNGITYSDSKTTGTSLLVIQADYTAVNNAIAIANALNASDYSNFADVTAAINAVQWNLNVLNQSTVNSYAEAIETAISNLKKVELTEETVTVSDPVEDTNTKTEDEGETVSEPEVSAETNPTTGVALSLVPLAIAALAIVSSKRK